MKLLSDQSKWNEFAAKSPDGGFLSSWQWGVFQEALGNAVYPMMSVDQQWLALGIQLRAGSQWIMTIPRGPVFIGNGEASKESLDGFLQEIVSFAKERQCFLLRLGPPYESGMPESTVFQSNSRLDKAAKDRQPLHTLVMQTDGSEEELLAGMKSKHRYNLRLAEKKGVVVREGQGQKDLQAFASLMDKTTERQSFASYDAEYFEMMQRSLGDSLKLLVAEYEGKIIAGMLVSFFGKRAIYLHGGSDYEHRKLMSPFLLQWEAIKEAKKRGMEYDFWGVASDPPANKHEEGWAGITRFKKGFCPSTEITAYLGTYEVPVMKGKYYLYKLRQSLKK